jgi:hypothetical protein
VQSDLIGVFGWVGMAYSASAVVATLLYLTYRQSGAGVLMATVPVLAMMLATLHYVFRQQEADEAVRAPAPRPPNAKPHWPRATCRSWRPARGASTAPSRTLPSAWRCWTLTAASCRPTPRCKDLLGRCGDELVQMRFQDLAHEDDRAGWKNSWAWPTRVNSKALRANCAAATATANRSGWPRTAASSPNPVPATPCLILQAQDITARRKAEEGLHHIAFHDSADRLPNRRRFHEHLEAAVQRALADPHDAYAVMFLDFDRFKLINDSLGHNAGDEFLVQVSRRIQASLRPQTSWRAWAATNLPCW